MIRSTNWVTDLFFYPRFAWITIYKHFYKIKIKITFCKNTKNCEKYKKYVDFDHSFVSKLGHQNYLFLTIREIEKPKVVNDESKNNPFWGNCNLGALRHRNVVIMVHQNVGIIFQCSAKDNSRFCLILE